MNKLFAIFKREYLQVVRKKAFIILTILGPFLMALLMVVPMLVATKGFGEKRLVVVDGSGRLQAVLEEASGTTGLEKPKKKESALEGRNSPPVGKLQLEWIDAKGAADLKVAAAPYLERLRSGAEKNGERLDGVLLVPASVFDKEKTKATYYSRASTDLMAQEQIARIVSRGVSRERLSERGLDPAEIERLLRDVQMETVQLTKEGGEKKGGELNFLFGFVFVMLLNIPILMYGQEVMRGIIQEKSDRVVEILVSSMSPLELLSGKILGIAAVGLTQIGVWLSMGAAMTLFMGAAGSVAFGGNVNVLQMLRPAILGWFLVFFVLGYLVYVCIYAVAGACVNTEKEAQNLIGPIVMILMVPWFLLMPLIMNPESPMSTVLSLIPIYTPITMFVRILVSQPPVWQICLSLGLSLVTIYGLFWVTAKIFRVGILSYGKRPTIPELWRWLKVA